MRIKLTRLGIIFLAVLVQISILPVIFSANFAPNLILLLIISWVIIVDFRNILIWIVIAGVISDLIFFRTVGTSVIFFVILAYVISFLSRRFLIENKNWGFLMMAFFVSAATIFYGFFNILINNQLIESFHINSWSGILLLRKDIAVQVIFNLLLFPLCYFILTKLEKRLSFYDKKINLK